MKPNDKLTKFFWTKKGLQYFEQSIVCEVYHGQAKRSSFSSNVPKRESGSIPLSVSGITSQDLFHTSRHSNFAIPTHVLLYVASFAQILGRNVIHSWFREIKRNLLCSYQDIKIPTSRSVVKYGIGIYKISREVWNSSLSLHCYCFGRTIQQLQEVREVGFCSL